MKNNKLDQLAVDAIRVLSMNAITAAKSGHPGIALGAAPIMYELFAKHLDASPIYQDYFNRDRFVLSAGHGSALLYATMLVCQYGCITIEDLKKFRQIDSKTPGHPESSVLPGVEVCTGPLGQGIAMAVGLAIAERKLSRIINLESKVVNHFTYCLFGDGCLEEGIAYEALSIAGHLNLSKLIMFYDSNNIQLDGRVSDSTSMNTRDFFKSLGWNYILVKDPNNLASVGAAIKKAQRSYLKPTVIECKTTIGFGSSLANTNAVHGAPLTPLQVEELKRNLNYDHEDFLVPKELASIQKKLLERTETSINEFNEKLNAIERINTEFYNSIITIIKKDPEFVFDMDWYKPEEFVKAGATRDISGKLLQPIAGHNANLIVDSVDLTSSTKIKVNNSPAIISRRFEGQNINLGVREFAMAAINNGITAHGGCKAIGSTFMAFSDYNKAAIRVAALSKIGSINVYSHDSITVGEDGPTHQPIEQLWTLRLIPNHYVFRPCNNIDMLVAWEKALLSKTTPSSIITSRLDFNFTEVNYEEAKKGGYVIYTPGKKHDLTIYATGSEVDLAIQVAKGLKIKTRVVAINSLELLNEQSKTYLATIFDGKPKVSIEFGCTTPWYKYVDLAIGVDEFGHSGKPKDVIAKLGLTKEDIIAKISKWYNK